MVRKSLLAVSDFVWPRSSPFPRWTAACWILLAALSVLSAGQTVATSPANQHDFFEVRTWIQLWTAGVDPYRELNGVDYPPSALPVLSWMGLASDQVAGRLFPLVTGAALVAAAWMLVRWFGRLVDAELSGLEVATLGAMVLACRGARRSLEFGQTAPIAIAALVAAMLLAKRRPWLSGILLGVASFKVNLVVGFGLALLAIGSLIPLVVAGAVVLGLFAFYAATVHQSLAEVVTNYLASVTEVYGGPDYVRGALGFRVLLTQLVGDYEKVRFLYPLGVGLLLGVVATLIVVRRPLDRRGRSLVAMTCVLWALLSLPQQGYNSLLLLPAVWMMGREDADIIRTPWLRRTLPTLALLPLIVNLPGVLANEAGQLTAGSHPLFARAVADFLALWRHVDAHGRRLVLIVVFAVVIRELAQPRRLRPPYQRMAAPDLDR